MSCVGIFPQTLNFSVAEIPDFNLERSLIMKIDSLVEDFLTYLDNNFYQYQYQEQEQEQEQEHEKE